MKHSDSVAAPVRQMGTVMGLTHGIRRPAAPRGMLRPVANSLATLMIAVWVVMIADPAPGLPGDLDPAFGTDGIVTLPVGSSVDVAYDVELQGDGKIVVTGGAYDSDMLSQFAVVRLQSNGQPDPAFSGDGIATTTLSAEGDVPYGLAIQDDGRIVIAGTHSLQLGSGTPGFAVVRYDTDGTLDESFSGDGKVTTPIGSAFASAEDVAIDPDGRIVVVGTAYTSDGTDFNNNFAVVRYNADGTLDESFDGDGMLTTPIGSSADGAGAVAIQADERLVVAGWTNDGGDENFALARYDTDGTLDGTFGGDGIVTTDIANTDNLATAVAVQADQRIVAAGLAGRAFALTRYGTDGTLDASFSGDGRVTTPVGTVDLGATGVAIQENGRILAGGSTSQNGDRFVLVRYRSDGTLDPSFAGDGTVTTKILGGSQANGLALGADGFAVLAGFGGDPARDFAVARYEAIPPYQADAKIKGPGTTSYVGDDVYNTTGVGQTRLDRSQRGTEKTFLIRVENDGTSTDSFTIRGPGSKPGFAIHYLEGGSGTSDITTAVVGGTYTFIDLPAAAESTLRLVIRIRKSADVGVVRSWRILATSQTEPTRQDVVVAKVKVVAR